MSSWVGSIARPSTALRRLSTGRCTVAGVAMTFHATNVTQESFPSADDPHVLAGEARAPHAPAAGEIEAGRSVPTARRALHVVPHMFASSAIATFPSARRSPMMPDPTTAANSNEVPMPSATTRRAESECINRRSLHRTAAAVASNRVQTLRVLRAADPVDVETFEQLSAKGCARRREGVKVHPLTDEFRGRRAEPSMFTELLHAGYESPRLINDHPTRATA